MKNVLSFLSKDNLWLNTDNNTDNIENIMEEFFLDYFSNPAKFHFNFTLVQAVREAFDSSTSILKEQRELIATFTPDSPAQEKIKEIINTIKGYLSGNIQWSFKQAAIDEVDKFGYTKLMYATTYHENQKALKLLDQGANPFKISEFNDSAFFIALRKTNIELVKKFIQKQNLSLSLEISKFLKDANEGELYYRIASDMINEPYELRTQLGLEKTAHVCFAYATQACETLGVDTSDLFEEIDFS